MNPLKAHLNTRSHLTCEEEAILVRLAARRERVASKTELVAEGSSPFRSCLLIEGMAVRQHYLADGKRMISAVHVAGDFVDLHGFLMDTMDHSVVAATSCEVAWVMHSDLRTVTETQPRLTRLLWRTVVEDAAIIRANITAMGRLKPAARLAHFACELYLRLERVAKVSDHSFRIPFTQYDLADILGMSVVHLNRSLQALRATDTVSWEADLVTIKDWQRLTELGQFDAGYLNLGASKD